jgi:Protein of unknown function (DUF3293)
MTADDPWDGYARVVVEIVRDRRGILRVQADPTGRVGRWPWDSPEPVHILTAWNPGHERPGDAANRARQAELEADLTELAPARWSARGTIPGTAQYDEGVAVQGLEAEQARALGARYGQDAVFEWTPGEWAIVGCRESRRVAFGWSAETTLGAPRPSS